MGDYWFIVKSTNDALFEALQQALAGRAGFHLVKDRRGEPGRPPSTGERRIAQTWEGGEITIAETGPDGAHFRRCHVVRRSNCDAASRNAGGHPRQ